MHFSTQNFPPYLTCFFFFCIISLFSLALSDPRISEAGLLCGQIKAINYIPNFVKAMEVLAQLVTAHHWGSHIISPGSPPIYGLAQCYQDLSHTDCLLCYAASRTKLPRCLPASSARLYLDGCFLRYDEYNFFNETTDPVRDKVNCSSSVGQITDGSGDGDQKAARLAQFKKNVGNLIDNVTRIAVLNGGFGVAKVNGVYGLAQCWKTVSSDGCGQCLAKASIEVRECVPSREGRGLNAGCYLRYSTQKFYHDGPESSESSSGITATGAIVAISLAAAALLMMSLFASYTAYVRMSKLKAERNNLGQMSDSVLRSRLNYKYEILEKATNYFDASKKIGQGGAGSVFKGTLPNGQTVAVKRLFFNTRQWVDEFFNEVNLISGIENKNLVKLLGCSIEGPESLLVYEYVPNKSLDHFLFDKNRTQVLDWKQRFNIIVGTAEGLAYLHGGCEVRIIHRDIKNSNILLDENLAPKIADFGLARCFGADKTHLSTGIAGTLGYMAPEYLVQGQLTEKADVFGYGVLVLEIVCGKRNTALIEGSSSLLQKVWQLYRMDKLVDSIEPCLKDEVSAKEVSDVLLIGLLCTQASAALRPSMQEVVQMLTNRDCEIPEPNQPPFLNARVLNSANSGGKFSLNHLISNALTKIEMSSSSTESSSLRSSNGPPTSEESR